MANEKRLIWDEDAKRHIIALAVGHHTDTLPVDMVVNAILHHSPTVDAVEVVRCMDCENWRGPWLVDQTFGVCQVGRKQLTEPNHFCSYGERRTDNA